MQANREKHGDPKNLDTLASNKFFTPNEMNSYARVGKPAAPGFK